jgi:2-C-methyl-D-erythritol 2,4-cyclodiphosphate synthase
MGLLGHSDADVLIHAIMDAILGAAAMGDIGRHFPDTDGRFKNASSLLMLEEVGKMLAAASLSVGNIDSVIVAQQPKLADFLPLMAENIASALGIHPEAVNVKASTEEKMGFTGTGEGMAAHAAALLY